MGGETVTTISSVRLTLAGALALASATLAALTVIFEFAGRTEGAVYSPALAMVPTAELPPATAFTLQATLVFEVPVTVA